MKRFGFTLAEVLITLGIIGVVAALTMPSIISNIQKTILKNQFKKAYSLFSQGVMQAQANLGGAVSCSYYSDNRQLCSPKCNDRNEYGSCTSYSCEDGSPLPANVNGVTSDCVQFEDELFFKTLKTVKFCQNAALANGCLTSQYKGVDKVKKELNSSSNPDPNLGFTDSNIKNRWPAFILSDGIIIIKYGSYRGGNPIYAIDINGHKAPNKWGHDIFTFQLSGEVDGIQKVGYSSQGAVEKGGKTTRQMIKDSL